MGKTKKVLKAALGVFSLALCVSVNAEAVNALSSINIDGKCDEWDNIKPVAEDVAGDVSSDTPESIDYVKGWVVRDSDNIYFSYLCAKSLDWNATAWRCNIFINTDDNAATGYKGYNGTWPIGADYLIQGGKLFQFIGKGPMAWDWKELSSLPYSVADTQVEIQSTNLALGIKPGQKIEILFHGDNQPGKPEFMPDNGTITLTK